MCINKSHTPQIHFGVAISQVSTNDKDSAQSLIGGVQDAYDAMIRDCGKMVKALDLNIQTISHRDRNPYFIITVKGEEVSSNEYGELNCYECN